MKHVDVKRLWLQGELREGRLSISRVSSAKNLADLFTKGLPPARLQVLLKMIALGEESNGQEKVVDTD